MIEVKELELLLKSEWELETTALGVRDLEQQEEALGDIQSEG